MFGLVVGLGVRLGGGLVGGLGLGLVDALTERGTAPGLPMGPRQAWRNDRLSGVVVGLGGGVGLVGSQTWPTTLAWLQLQLASQVAAVSLIPFLEDARERDILRTVGAVYQFRHATLQDQLAAIPRPS
ncbi:MAG: hypothetical protein ACRDQ4_15100 [Pseudonocardiaceae bacterium]